MSSFLITLANMSISASFMVLAVLVIRLVSRNSPKWLNCLLWGIVAFRLSIPFSIESIFCLLSGAYISSPSSKQIYAEGVLVKPQSNSLIGSESSVGNSVTGSLGIFDVLFYIWCIGLSVMIVYAAVSYFITSRRIIGSVKKKDNIYYSDNISSPFVFGIFRPHIYIPTGLSKKSERYVVSHETAHIKRLDHITRPIAFIILSFHWFNPLVWLAYIMFCRDVEFACDEKATADVSKNQRKRYSLALIDCSVSKKLFSVSPVGFAEASVKKRVVSVLSYKKPKLATIFLTVIMCAIAVACFMTSPVKADEITKSTVDNNTAAVLPDATENSLESDPTEPETIPATECVPVTDVSEPVTESIEYYNDYEYYDYGYDYYDYDDSYEYYDDSNDYDAVEFRELNLSDPLAELIQQEISNINLQQVYSGSYRDTLTNPKINNASSVLDQPIVWDYNALASQNNYGSAVTIW